MPNSNYVLVALLLLIFGCGEERAKPSFSVSRNVELGLDAAELIGPENVGGQFRWEVIDAPVALPGGVFTAPTMAKTKFVGFATGRYVLSLTIFSNENEARYEVFVSVENDAPIVEAPSYAIVEVQSPISLSVGDSSDRNGDPLTYQWDVIDVPIGSDLLGVRFESGNSTGPEFVPDVSGAFSIEVSAIDVEGAIGTAAYRIDSGFFAATGESISEQGATLMIVGRDEIHLIRNDFERADMVFAGPLWSAKLFQGGTLAVVIEGNRLQVIDTNAATISQTILLLGTPSGRVNNGAIIGIGPGESVYIERPGEILAVDLSTGTQSTFEMDTIRTSISKEYDVIVYDSQRGSFYSRNFQFINGAANQSWLRKWNFGQGVMVETERIVQPYEFGQGLYIFEERRELVDLDGGHVYTIPANSEDSLVPKQAIGFASPLMQFDRPDQDDWGVGIEFRGISINDELVVYTPERPFGQEQTLEPFIRYRDLLDIAVVGNSRNVYLLADNPFGGGAVVLNIPLDFE